MLLPLCSIHSSYCLTLVCHRQSVALSCLLSALRSGPSGFSHNFADADQFFKSFHICQCRSSSVSLLISFVDARSSLVDLRSRLNSATSGVLSEPATVARARRNTALYEAFHPPILTSRPRVNLRCSGIVSSSSDVKRSLAMPLARLRRLCFSSNALRLLCSSINACVES